MLNRENREELYIKYFKLEGCTANSIIFTRITRSLQAQIRTLYDTMYIIDGHLKISVISKRLNKIKVECHSFKGLACVTDASLQKQEHFMLCYL